MSHVLVLVDFGSEWEVGHYLDLFILPCPDKTSVKLKYQLKLKRQLRTRHFLSLLIRFLHNTREYDRANLFLYTTSIPGHSRRYQKLAVFRQCTWNYKTYSQPLTLHLNLKTNTNVLQFFSVNVTQASVRNCCFDSCK